jgi:DNA-binding response OmpR family regulator
MQGVQRPGPRECRDADDLSDAPRAVVLVGEAAKDHDHIEALLSADVIVILLPKLETMHALLTPERRQGRASPSSRAVEAVGNLRVDLTEHRVLLGERELPVTERELAILATLCEEPGRARSFAELAEPGGRAWLGDTERVHAAIRRLRKKLAKAGVRATIESVRGYGFRILGRSIDPSPVIRGGSGPLPDEVPAAQRGE